MLAKYFFVKSQKVFASAILGYIGYNREKYHE